MATELDYPIQATKTDITYLLNRILQLAKCEHEVQPYSDALLIKFYKKGWFSTKMYQFMFEPIFNSRTGKLLYQGGDEFMGVTLAEGEMRTRCLIATRKALQCMQEVPDGLIWLTGMLDKAGKQQEQEDMGWNPYDC